ncbi:Acetyltransferase involved in cellulose biosynthesis, CelD/BcsL family [Rhizobiales bacterium GAS191]|nr:Acetyltransferase involved in cellulose biosynthesis, CelD/BcsL family [Rhizobiales bacterium GAS191]
MLTAAGVEYDVRGWGQEVRTDEYSVAVAKSFADAERTLGMAGPLAAASPFQHRTWLATWFETAGRHPHVVPLVASIRDEARGQVAMVLPLIELRQNGRILIEFADLGVTDYNAPLLGPAAPHCVAGARKLWAALTRHLPKADAIRLTKMPGVIAGRPNPLALLSASQPSSLHGNVLKLASYDEFKRDRGRTYRKELERSWRVFERLGGTEFRRVTDVESALGVLQRIEEQQERRIRGLGLPYILDTPDIANFYRELVIGGLGSGYTVMTVLLAGEDVVAALLGVRDDGVFSMVRISNAGEAWRSCSPGRLVITRTIEQLSAEGCGCFDFTIGDYEFKRRLGGERLELFELTQARSLRGLPMAAEASLKGHLRRHPRLAKWSRQLFQRRAAGPRLMMAQS